MSCLEIIRVRTHGLRRAELLARLDETISESADLETVHPGEVTVRLYWNTTIDTDLCVLVQLDRPRPPSAPHATGSALAEALREYGVVEHSTWFSYQTSTDETSTTDLDGRTQEL